MCAWTVMRKLQLQQGDKSIRNNVLLKCLWSVCYVFVFVPFLCHLCVERDYL